MDVLASRWLGALGGPSGLYGFVVVHDVRFLCCWFLQDAKLNSRGAISRPLKEVPPEGSLLGSGWMP